MYNVKYILICIQLFYDVIDLPVNASASMFIDYEF